MHYSKNTIETTLYLDAASHEIVSEVFIDGVDDPIAAIAVGPRELVRSMIEDEGYTDDQLDMFLDSLYQAVEILENHLNGEEGEDE